MTIKTAAVGINIYSVIGLLLAAGILFHLTSKEETIIGMIAVVAIAYIVMG